MRIVSEEEVGELVAKGKMSVRDRLKSGIMPAAHPQSEVSPEARMAASLEKLAVLTATIATEINKPKMEKMEMPETHENDKLVETLDKMSGLIEMLVRRIDNPPVKKKKSYDLAVERDTNGFMESLRVKEI